MVPQLLQRISVRWLPEPAYEDTDTIALNVGGYFLDLRVTKAEGSIQWSRAGERKIVKQEPFTYQWTRLIDSTGTLDPDEATWDWQKLGNGCAFEAGTAHCPTKNGALTSYEEIWRDITRAGPTTSSWILQSVDGMAFLGSVGGTFLGIRENSDGSFAVRREEWDIGQGSWSVKFEGGDNSGSIPRVEAILKQLPTKGGAENREVGGKVSLGRVDYVVRAIDIGL